MNTADAAMDISGQAVDAHTPDDCVPSQQEPGITNQCSLCMHIYSVVSNSERHSFLDPLTNKQLMSDTPLADKESRPPTAVSNTAVRSSGAGGLSSDQAANLPPVETLRLLADVLSESLALPMLSQAQTQTPNDTQSPEAASTFNARFIGT